MNNSTNLIKLIFSIAITLLFTIVILLGTLRYLYYLFINDSVANKADYIEQGVVISIAVISACISIITNILSSYANEKDKVEQLQRESTLRQQQEAFEEKWNQAKIDADLIAKARITWIENVRIATSHFIAACYGLMRVVSNNYDDEMNKQHLIAKENGLLLMLYCGPDSKPTDSDINDITNNGKNEEVYKLIHKALDLIEILYSKEEKQKLQKQIDDKTEYLELQYESLPIDHVEYCKENDAGSDYEIPIEIPDENTQEYIKYQNEKNQFDQFKYQNSPMHLQKILLELTDLIRNYLKIEWDIAKKENNDS